MLNWWCACVIMISFFFLGYVTKAICGCLRRALRYLVENDNERVVVGLINVRKVVT